MVVHAKDKTNQVYFKIRAPFVMYQDVRLFLKSAPFNRSISPILLPLQFILPSSIF